MITETERLILRRYTTDDLIDMYEYLSDEEVVKFEPYKPMSNEETKDNLHFADRYGRTWAAYPEGHLYLCIYAIVNR